MTQVLRHLTPVTDPNVLIGPSTSEDVGAYRFNEETALVATTDFFAPVVDDPYWFGAIAAANALSDVYAKGAEPIFALNLVGFPSKKLDLDILNAILRGGAEKAQEAGVSIIGGHSVDDEEPKYGLAVVGVCHPNRIIRNSGAVPGDLLVLTKPLGTGIITTALKRGLVDETVEREVTQLMAVLNKSACRAMVETGVHAATDITGYGLLGHLQEMMSAGKTAARVFLTQVPILPAVANLLQQQAVPGGTRNNLKFISQYVSWHYSMEESHRLILCDAQTSGGLLIAVAPEKAPQLLAKLREYSTPVSAVIGEVTSGAAGTMEVLP